MRKKPAAESVHNDTNSAAATTTTATPLVHLLPPTARPAAVSGEKASSPMPGTARQLYEGESICLIPRAVPLQDMDSDSNGKHAIGTAFTALWKTFYDLNRFL